MDLCITPQTGMDNLIRDHGKPVHKPWTRSLILSATCPQLANSLPTIPDKVTHTGKSGQLYTIPQPRRQTAETSHLLMDGIGMPSVLAGMCGIQGAMYPAGRCCRFPGQAPLGYSFP